MLQKLRHPKVVEFVAVCPKPVAIRGGLWDFRFCGFDCFSDRFFGFWAKNVRFFGFGLQILRVFAFGFRFSRKL